MLVHYVEEFDETLAALRFTLTTYLVNPYESKLTLEYLCLIV
jgi:hypothetical protein